MRKQIISCPSCKVPMQPSAWDKEGQVTAVTCPQCGVNDQLVTESKEPLRPGQDPIGDNWLKGDILESADTDPLV